MARAAYVALDDVIAVVEFESEPFVDFTNDEGATCVVLDDHLVPDWSSYPEYRRGAVTATRVRLNSCFRYFFSVLWFACGNRRLSVEHVCVHFFGQPSARRVARRAGRGEAEFSRRAGALLGSSLSECVFLGYVFRFYVPSRCI